MFPIPPTIRYLEHYFKICFLFLQMTQRKQWDKVKMKGAVIAVKKKDMGFTQNIWCPEVNIKGLRKKGKKPLWKTFKNYWMYHWDASQFCLRVVGEVIGVLYNYGVFILRSNVFTARDLKRMAFKLAIRNNIVNIFSKDKKRAGRKLLRPFFKRHPTLSLRKPLPLSLQRIQGYLKRQCR